MSLSKEIGRKDGYITGWQHGQFLGHCESIRRLAPGVAEWWDIRVLFVTSGMGIPYSPLDAAIFNSLSTRVRHVDSITPDQNVVSWVAINRPDIVVVLNGMNFSVDQIDAIRAKGIRTAVWFTDDPYYTDVTTSIAPHYDFVYTLELSCVSFYQSIGCRNVHYLPFAADISAFRPKYVEPSFRKQVCFIGTAYWNRVHFFEQVVPFLAKMNVHISGWWWNRLTNYKLIESKIATNDFMDSNTTSSYYTGSQIVINMHRSVDDDSWNQNNIRIPALSPNPRTFEIAASGAFQLTDIRQDLGNLYRPDQEIATYSSPQEMIHKIMYYLHHEDERKQIAWNGLKRTLEDHTYDRRLAQLLNKIF